MCQLVPDVDYMLYIPNQSTPHGLVQGNYDKLPKGWVPAGEICTSAHTCSKQKVWCAPENVARVKQEIIDPSWVSAAQYKYPVWM